MKAFLIGCLIGAGLVYVCVHRFPSETKAAMSQGVGTAASAAQGALAPKK